MLKQKIGAERRFEEKTSHSAGPVPRLGSPPTLIAELDAAMVRPADRARGRIGQSDGAMGRSQVVRQRILIPPVPGSNPGAPARVNALDSLPKRLCSHARF